MTVKQVKKRKSIKPKKIKTIQKNIGRGPNININIDQSKKTRTTRGITPKKTPQIITTFSQAPQPPPPQPQPFYNFPLPTNLNPFDASIRATQKENVKEQPNELEKPKPKEKEKEVKNEDVIDLIELEKEYDQYEKDRKKPKEKVIDLKELEKEFYNIEKEYEEYQKNIQKSNIFQSEPEVNILEKTDDVRIRTPLERGSNVMTIQDMGKPKEKKNIEPSFIPFKGEGNILNKGYVDNMEREMTIGGIDPNLKQKYLKDDLDYSKESWVDFIENEIKRKNQEATKKEILPFIPKKELLPSTPKKEIIEAAAEEVSSVKEAEEWKNIKKTKYNEKLDTMDLDGLKQEAKTKGVLFKNDKKETIKNKLLNKFEEDEKQNEMYNVFTTKDIEKYKKITKKHKEAEKEADKEAEKEAEKESVPVYNIPIEQKKEVLLIEEIDRYIKKVGKDELRGDMRYFSSNRPELNPRKSTYEYRSTPENKELFKEFLLKNPQEYKNLKQYKGGKNK